MCVFENDFRNCAKLQLSHRLRFCTMRGKATTVTCRPLSRSCLKPTGPTLHCCFGRRTVSSWKVMMGASPKHSGASRTIPTDRTSEGIRELESISDKRDMVLCSSMLLIHAHKKCKTVGKLPSPPPPPSPSNCTRLSIWRRRSRGNPTA